VAFSSDGRRLATASYDGTRMVPTRRSLEQLHWLMLATLPLHALLSGLGSATAQDVAQGLKRLVGRGLGAKRSRVRCTTTANVAGGARSWTSGKNVRRRIPVTQGKSWSLT
jgi:hypothetical protein